MGRAEVTRTKKRIELALSAHFIAGTGRFPAELGYLNEMAWLKEHGIISSWRDYDDMPLRTWSDARMVMYAEGKAQQQKRQRPPAGRRR